MWQRVHVRRVPGLPGARVCSTAEGHSRLALAMDTDTKLGEQDRGEGGRHGAKRQAAAASHVQKICEQTQGDGLPACQYTQVIRGIHPFGR